MEGGNSFCRPFENFKRQNHRLLSHTICYYLTWIVRFLTEETSKNNLICCCCSQKNLHGWPPSFSDGVYETNAFEEQWPQKIYSEESAKESKESFSIDRWANISIWTLLIMLNSKFLLVNIFKISIISKYKEASATANNSLSCFSQYICLHTLLGPVKREWPCLSRSTSLNMINKSIGTWKSYEYFWNGQIVFPNLDS